MPSTHLSLNFHVVFSTKDRFPLIALEWRERLHAYLGGIVRNLGAVPLMTGGVADHVHLLLGLPATKALADIVRSIKANSSRWVHDEIGQKLFSGRTDTELSPLVPPRVRQSRTTSPSRKSIIASGLFQEEYVSLLAKSGVGYDERFLW